MQNSRFLNQSAIRCIVAGLLILFWTEPGAAELEITTFTASPQKSRLRQIITFKWVVSGAGADCEATLAVPDIRDIPLDFASCNVPEVKLLTSGILNKPGNFFAWLTIRSEGETVEKTIPYQIVNEPPQILSFMGTPQNVYVGQPVTFSWSIRDDDGDTLSCALDADSDGTNDFHTSDGNAQNTATHIYTTAGTYKASFSVDDLYGGLGGAIDTSITIEVNGMNISIASFVHTPTDVHTNKPVTFSWSINNPDRVPLKCEVDLNVDLQRLCD